MINFPIFDQLDILEYGLYPGTSPDIPGLHIQFQPGLTLILGANGLGKSTLVTILYRLLAGPFEIRGISSTTTLGGIRLTPTGLSSRDRATFAQRVSDNARKATARLSFRLDDHRVVIERNLSDLKLTHFSIDGRQLEPLETESFHIEIPKLVGVWSFGDWILVLRHLVFYFEDRRALVWNPTAQRQILRLLFLPAEIARKWSQDERVILELDSRARNLRAVVFREEQALVDTESKVEKGADVHSELITLEELQQIDIEQRERLDSELIQTDSRRQQARLRVLTLEQDRETRFREMERAKLTAIEARFPRKSETARFILAQLMIDANC